MKKAEKAKWMSIIWPQKESILDSIYQKFMDLRKNPGNPTYLHLVIDENGYLAWTTTPSDKVVSCYCIAPDPEVEDPYYLHDYFGEYEFDNDEVMWDSIMDMIDIHFHGLDLNKLRSFVIE